MSRIAGFFVALASWYAIAFLVSGGRDALPYVLFFGTFWALPTTVCAAIADGLAAAYFPKRQTFGFLIFGGAAILLGCAFLEFGPGAWSNKPFNTVHDTMQFLSTMGLPGLAVFAVYAIANVMREESGDPATKPDQAPSP